MERIRRFIRELSENQWLETRKLTDWRIERADYGLPGQYEHIAPYTEGQGLEHFPSKQGTTYFFRTCLNVPEEWSDEAFGLRFESGGEGLLRVNGSSYQGLDRNHTYVTLDPRRTGRTMELEIELFDPIPEPVDPLNRQAVIQPPITSVTSLIARPNHAVQSLMYTTEVVADSAKLLPDTDFRKTRLFEALYKAMDHYVSLASEAVLEGKEITTIEQALRCDVGQIGSNAEGHMHMVGQSHIDIAWLWPVRETVRKTSRTFSTVDALMNEYPGYNYTQSQPLLFHFLKENDPELFERVKSRIKEGRWELVGGMWVEPDLNIPSGESLIRQMLYGQRFYQEEFGKTSRIEWLPDTFGYCASLPQILKHGNIDYFMTTKLGWNDTNPFPYDLFYWVGIDGTPILSYLNHGVNEHTMPKDIHDHWQSYREKAMHSEQMLLYGHGDGGGGVTREMLEYIDRAELMVGQPVSRYSTAADFFAGTEQAGPKLPKWRGDLYLELHRGTYTTHGRNKRNNRKAEILYREAELWQALTLQKRGKQETEGISLQEGWKLILLNQFHDIIPGSAIKESYETSDKEYKEIFDIGNASLQANLTELAASIHTEGVSAGRPYIVFNSLGWNRSALVQLESETQPVKAYDETGQELLSDYVDGSVIVHVPDIPKLGYKAIWLQSEAGIETSVKSMKDEVVSINQWETEYYKVLFNERGEIIRLFDKECNREIVKPGERANRFQFFHDRPTLWDAWDIDPRYEQQEAGEAELLDQRLISQGVTGDVIRFRWRIHNSEMTQDLIFYHDHKRIDFKTAVTWNEAHKLLKVSFPIHVVTDKATYEIPFGALERPTHRNTSWEQAQYEVCGHRYADVSEHGYGVSLLNDCKYGYDIQDSTIRLSLLRAPKWPDDSADLGEHHFTYSLYPHEGDWRSGHTVRQAAELNTEVSVLAAERRAARLASTGSFIELDSSHVILDTVKPSESGEGFVLRLYESAGGREDIQLKWPYPVAEAYLSNALEEKLSPLSMEEGEIKLAFAPYEIKTVLIKARS
ncbi:alpha-mannosidase [Paenibacillus urinalis]|uniref:alpha-mannosidase n=1 Tax=Paenibacillus urinalis TaxID=521520 RepID=UPI00195F3179